MTFPFYIKNKKIVSYKGAFQLFNIDSPVIYEVIRVMDGKVLFFEDHVSRFLYSALKADFIHNLSGSDIKDSIDTLLYKNNIIQGNVKFLLQKVAPNEINFFAFGIPHYYPSAKEYSQGIYTILYRAERENPEIKLQRTELKNNIDEALKEKNAFEAILVHPNGYITEGSKSNFFLIKNETVYTAPEADVLSGVTRKNLIVLFHDNHINCHELRIPAVELKNFEGAFISGTSPKVLPVRQIGELVFNVNLPLLQKIMFLYDKQIENYLKNT